MPLDPAAVKSLFLELVEIEEPVARAARMLDRCVDDAELMARVNALLAANDRADLGRVTAVFTGNPTGADLFTKDPVGDARSDIPGRDERVGTLLSGKYKLIEEIGEGGMGQVYMAQQIAPVKRAVAVKVIKAGMDSKMVLARFEAERQALAIMDHPNIARVLDAGTTESGRPFFAMELVKGVPITQFCDAHKLTPRQRLELFVPVCQAIQHAHQKGVIHRDIKPSNVLIALYDDHPVPKVIDFGVAKAVGQPLTEQTLNTGFGTVVGTPEYMSPEQALFNNLDIDTRSDVYSLGVLLYELLSGSPPVSRKSLEKVGLLEILRLVREEEPPRPSTRLSTAETLPTLAANRSMEPRKLTRSLRHELDWIVMKALEKDRRRRYETANGFAVDVLRYLSGEPVQAVPPSAGYRVRKFFLRHRGPVIGTLALGVTLALGTLGTTLGLLRAERAKTAAADLRFLAEKQDADLARAEISRAKAEAEVERQRHVEAERRQRNGDAAAALLAQAESALRAGEAQRASEAFEQAQKRIAEGVADDWSGRLNRYRIDLEMLRELDRIDNDSWTAVDGNLPSLKAIALRWEQAFAKFGIALGATSLQHAAGRIDNSFVRERLLIALEQWFVESQRPGLRELLAAVDPDAFRNEARVTNYCQAMLSWTFRGKQLAPSQPVWFAIGHGVDPTLGRDVREHLLTSALRVRPSSFQLLMNLGKLATGNETESATRSIGWYRAALAVQPASAVAWNNLGNVLIEAADLPGAVVALQEAVRLDPGLAHAYSNLGVALKKAGDLPGAIEAYKNCIRLNPNYATAHTNLGNALKLAGDLPGSIAAHTEAIRLDSTDAIAHFNLGISLKASGDLPGAIAAFRKSMRFDPNDSRTHDLLGIALFDSGDKAGAVAAFRGAIRLNPMSAPIRNNLARALDALGDARGAIAAYRESVRLDPHNATTRFNLGVTLFASGDVPEAIAMLRDAIRLGTQNAAAYYYLGKALKASGNIPAAIEAFRDAVRLDPQNAKAYSDLAIALFAAGDQSGALTAFREAIRLNPKDAAAHYNLGYALKNSGDLPGAILAFQEAVQLDPQDSSAQFNLGAVYFERKSYREAMPCFREAIKLNPQFADAHALLGIALLKTGDVSGARSALTEAARLDAKRYGPLLAQLPPVPLAPPPHEVKP